MRTRVNRSTLLRGLLPMLAVGGMLAAVQTAGADQDTGDVCMGKLFFDATGQKLNCTANDVRIAEALEVSPSSCEAGSLIDLTATFRVVLSGGGSKQTRYDIGLYFDTLGDPDNDGARGGTCAVTVIEPGDLQGSDNAGDPAFIDLDQNVSGQGNDICGDINTANNPLFPIITLHDVLCTGDGSTNCDGGECLLLPNCTSWRQPGSNELCDDAKEAIPGTSSKCNCDDNFTVPVTVTPASATLKKNPTQAIVTYELQVENTTPRPLTLDSLCDDIYGTIAGSGCPSPVLCLNDPTPGDGTKAGTCATDSSTACDIDADCPAPTVDTTTTTPCVVPQALAANDGTAGSGSDFYSCTFDVVVAAPGSSSPVTDVVTGTLTDPSDGQIFPVGSATVTVHLPQTP